MMQIVCSNHKRCLSSFFLCYLFIFWLLLLVLASACKISFFVPEFHSIGQKKEAYWPYLPSSFKESSKNLFFNTLSSPPSPLKLLLSRSLSYQGKKVRPLAPTLWEVGVGDQKVSLEEGGRLFLQWKGESAEFCISTEEDSDVQLALVAEDVNKGLIVDVLYQRENSFTLVDQASLQSIALDLPLKKEVEPLKHFSSQGMAFFGENAFLKEYSSQHGGRVALLSLPIKGEQGEFLGSNLLHVHAGDWIGLNPLGEWAILSPEQVQEQKEGLLHVLGYDSNGMCLQVWESAQSSAQDIVLAQENVDKDFGKSFVCSRVTPYGLNGVSVCLGKQSFVLRPGDWLIQVGDCWKQVLSVREMDAFLSWDLVGELFVFLGIENQCFVGWLFDETRTQKKLIREPVKS